MSHKTLSLIYVEWGSRSRDLSLTEVVRCIELASAVPIEIVIVDNKGDCESCSDVQGVPVNVMRGSNAAREFSGWDEGFAALSRPDQYDVLLLANDTLATHRTPRITRRQRFARWIDHAAMSSAPEMFGQRDPFVPAGTDSPFGPIYEYYSTYLFGLTKSAARIAFPLKTLDSLIEASLKNKFDGGDLFSASVPAAYRSKLGSWLHQPGNWFQAAPLTEDNFDFFRLKAKSILYEHALAAALEERGVATRDIFEGRGQLDRLAGRYAKSWLAATKIDNIKSLLQVAPHR